MSEATVLKFEHPAAECVVGEARLNVPATLNSLSLDMVRQLDVCLRDWQERDEVVGVLITGSGEKAFCAGGDVQALYRSVTDGDGYAYDFFEEEYRLDYFVHNFPKPLITLGHGIVMGGGLGIFGGSRYRVLTERSRLAFPEITIGLFPDAGGSWMLRRLPRHAAAFVGLTGCQVNAKDALDLGMGTHVIAHEAREQWREELLGLPWSPADNEAMLDDWLAGVLAVELPAAEFTAVPEQAFDRADVAGAVAQIEALAGRSKWVDRGIANLRAGCPTTAGIVLEQLARVGSMSLAEAFRMELTIATHCARNDDFAEGVRALLIDKDNQPQWRYNDFGSLPREHVLSHFEEPWEEHPLRDLGA